MTCDTLTGVEKIFDPSISNGGNGDPSLVVIAVVAVLLLLLRRSSGWGEADGGRTAIHMRNRYLEYAPHWWW